MTVQILESDYDKHSHVCSKYIQPGLDPPCGMRVLNVIATTTLASVAAAPRRRRRRRRSLRTSRGERRRFQAQPTVGLAAGCERPFPTTRPRRAAAM